MSVGITSQALAQACVCNGQAKALTLNIAICSLLTSLTWLIVKPIRGRHAIYPYHGIGYTDAFAC